MSRCAACNEILTATEIIWYEDIKEHEPVCRKCRAISLDIPIEDVEAMDAIRRREAKDR